ncbi:MAG: S41 family peptidase [Anaeromyxobacter sp.]
MLCLLSCAAAAGAGSGQVVRATPSTSTGPAVPAGAEVDDVIEDPVVEDEADPCRAELPPPPEACQGRALCSAQQRVQVACELREAMERRYVFFHLKGALLAASGAPRFDARAQLDGCVAAEAAVAEEDQPLRFHDRMRACLSAFEDGHLIPSLPKRLPPVALGLRVRQLADGAVVVAHLDPLLAAARAAEGGPVAPPRVGDALVAVDGRPVAAVLAELAAHVPGSSAAARQERAVDALTRRDFLYPAAATTALTLEDGTGRRTVTLRWAVGPDGRDQPLVRAWLARTGVTGDDRIDWRADARGPWLRERGDRDGLLRGDPVLAPEEAAALTPYTGDGGALAARLGQGLGPQGARYCYAQLLSFHSEGLSAGGRRRPYLDVLQDFVAGCQARGQDLVLDLRQNEGGYLAHSTGLAAMLGRPGETAPGGALVLRATARNERVYRARAPVVGALGPGGGRPVRDGSGAAEVLAAIREARQQHQELTPAFLDPPLRPSGDGFTGRVVALTSPACMSACDRLAALLRSSGRATLVGGPTEGAGASQQETKDLSARWTDAGSQLTVSIPNAAMGVLPPGFAGGTTAPPERFLEGMAFENRPVLPDVPYGTAREDVLARNQGWRAQVVAALAGSPAGRTPRR